MYLVFFAFRRHSERIVCYLILFGLLGLHYKGYSTRPLFTLYDWFKVPALVATVRDGQILCILDPHAGGEMLTFTYRWVPNTGACQGQGHWLVWTTF